jgi:hypothetical protein
MDMPLEQFKGLLLSFLLFMLTAELSAACCKFNTLNKSLRNWQGFFKKCADD